MPTCPLCHHHQTLHYHQKTDPHLGQRDYHLCPRCHLIFLDPKQRLTSAQEKAIYDQHQNNPKQAGYLQFLNKLALPLKTHLRKGSKGLDFGCGPGPSMGELLPDQKIKNYDPIFFPDQTLLGETYHFITCTEVVEHLFDPNQTFGTLKGLLHPRGGHLGIMTEVFRDDLDFASWWYHKDPTHVCFYRQSTFEWIGEAFGWEIEFSGASVVIFMA